MPKKQRSKMSKVTLVFGEFVSKKFDLELETMCPMEGEVITELNPTPMKEESKEIILGVKEDNNNSGIAVTEDCNKPSVIVTEDLNCSMATVTTGDTNNNFMMRVTEDDYNSTVAVAESKDESQTIVTEDIEDCIVSVGMVTEDKNESMATVAEDKNEPMETVAVTEDKNESTLTVAENKNEPMETVTVTATEDNNGSMVPPVPVIEDESRSVMTVTENDGDPTVTATEDNNNCEVMVKENNSDCVVTVKVTKDDDTPKVTFSEDGNNSQATATITDTEDDNNSVVTMTVDQNNCADSEDQNNSMDVEDLHNSVDTKNHGNNYPGPCTKDDHHNNYMSTRTGTEDPFTTSDIENHDDSTATEPLLANLDHFHPVPVNEDDEEVNVSKGASILSGVANQLSPSGTSPPTHFIKPKRCYYACTLCKEALPDKPLTLYHLVSFHYRELRSMGLSAEDNVANNDSLVNELTVEVSGSVKPVKDVISGKSTRNPQNADRRLANNKNSSEKPSKAEKFSSPRIHTDEKRLINSLPKVMRFQHPDHSVEVIRKVTVRIERLRFTALPPALLAAAKKLCVKKSANHFVCKKCKKDFGSYNGCYNHIRVTHYGEHRGQSGQERTGRKKVPSRSKNSKVSSRPVPVIGTPTNRDIDRGHSKTKKTSPTLVKFNFAKLSKRTD